MNNGGAESGEGLGGGHEIARKKGGKSIWLAGVDGNNDM